MKLQYAFAAATILMLQANCSTSAVLYVDLNGLNPVSPYSGWSTAATNIQDAVDASVAGETILVNDGIYASGSSQASDGTTNRVSITKAVTLRSVNGPALTVIDGANEIRCVYLTNGAVLTGFSLTRGNAVEGAGLRCESTNVFVSSCLIQTNSGKYGGGAYSGTLSNCTIIGNIVGFYGSGGGAYSSTLLDCTLSANTTLVGGGSGAGAAGCTLVNCTIANNTCNGTGASVGGGVSGSTLTNCTVSGNWVIGAGSAGGGAYASTLNNCTLSNNYADHTGGGAYECALTNCTLNSNRGSYSGGGVTGGTLVNCTLWNNNGGRNGGGANWSATLINCTLAGNYAQYGGGAYSCSLYNCIVYYNSGSTGPNIYGGTSSFCCTPDPGGVGNITNAPLISEYVPEFHLFPNSPCVNAGNNSHVGSAVDRDGNPRIVGGTVDIGAYEQQSATPSSGLPSVPTNFTAVLQSGQARLRWYASAKAASYTVKRASSFTSAYTNLATGIPATNYIDPTIVNGGTYIYVVTAVNAYGESAISPYAAVYTVGQFTFAPISSPQTSTLPFTVSISARDVNGALLTNFNGAAVLSGAGDHGATVVTPPTTSAFSNGQWTGSITIEASYPDTNVRLTCSSNAVVGVSSPFNVVPPSIQAFNLSAAALVHDPIAQRIYATVPASAPTFSNRLVVIDPVLGRIERSHYLGDDPSRMALSDDGQFLYLGFNGPNVFRRFNLVSNIVDLEVSLGASSVYPWILYHISDLVSLPGNPRSVAIGEVAYGYDTQILIFDDGVVRSNGLSGILADRSGTLVAASGSRLYAGFPFTRINLDGSGVANYDSHAGFIGWGEYIKYQNGFVFAPSGNVFNPETLAASPSLPPAAVIEPDLAVGRIFTLASPSANAWTLYAYDPTSAQAVGSLPLPGVLGSPTSLLRWGTNGLAFCTSWNQFWLLRSSLVPGGPPADLAISMSDTPHPATMNSNLTYSIQITNHGPNLALEVKLKNVLPAAASFVSATSTSGDCVWSNGIVTCDLGAIANGATASITVVVTPTVIGSFTNKVVISCLNLDSDMSDNSTMTVTPSQHSPFAATQPPWVPSSTSATLWGMAAPNGLPTAAWFEWGQRGNYSFLTTTTNVNAGGTMVTVGMPIGGLGNGIVYQYRFVASNQLGVAYGGSRLFTTGRKTVGWDVNGTQMDLPPGLSNAVALAAGGYHSLALKNDGTLVGWGDNSFGQAGMPAGVSSIVMVVAGEYHSLGIKPDGTLVAWGRNNLQQISAPGGLSDVVNVAAGPYHNLALRSNGSVAAWGWNDLGQINVPPGLSNIVSVGAGYYHSAVLRSDGTVLTWPASSGPQGTVPAGLSNVVAIACGAFHNLALKTDGTVAAWGENAGQISVPDGLSNVVTVAAGWRQSQALKEDGTIVKWGSIAEAPPELENVAVFAGGKFFCLADGDNVQPRAVSQIASSSANQDVVLALNASDMNGDLLAYRITSLPLAGSLYQFTNGVRGDEILAPDTPVTDAGLRVIFAPTPDASGKPYATFAFAANDGETDSVPATVSLNIGNTFAQSQPATRIDRNSVTLNGMVQPNGLATAAWFEWGHRGTYSNSTAVNNVGSASAVARVSQTIAGLNTGSAYQCRLVVSNVSGIVYGAPAIFTTGQRLAAWGAATYGLNSVPPGLSNVVTVAAGVNHNLSLTADGRVRAWGQSLYGQTNVPAGLSNVIAVAGGMAHSVSLKADGTLVAWGFNDYGQRNVPPGLSNVIAIAAGARHTLALKSDGSLTAWGWNHVGQSTVPPGLSNIVAMAAGQMHNLILKADGSVVTWGYGAYGLAQIPSAATNIVAVAAGDFHSLVLRSDGSVLAWGRHDQGQINVPGGLSNVVAIGHGVYHSLAIRSDGQLVVWGNSSSGQTNVPPGLSNVVIAAGVVASSVALGDNLPPQAISRTTNGPANRDLVLTLAGTDANGDLLSFRVSRMPTNGTLYQYTNGMRGAILDAADSIVGDANHRIVFAPATNGFGSPYTTFNFLVNDGDVDSLPALITINTAAPVTPAVVGGDWQTNGSFQLVLSGDSNTTYAVWTSTNLANWILLGTASPLSNSWFRYVDVDATNWPYRFYRSGTTQ